MKDLFSGRWCLLARAVVVAALLLTLPSFAGAYNYWSVTKASSPSSLSAYVTPPTGAGYVTSGSKTNITDAAITTADFTVVAPPGYSILWVKIDNVITSPISGDTYRVNKGTSTSHTIVAYYTGASYTITTTPAAGGYIAPSASVSGGDKSFAILPNTGYKVASVIVDGVADTTPEDGPLAEVLANGSYTFINITANHTLTATFAIVPKVTAVIGTPDQLRPLSNATILVDGTGSSGNVPATYTWSLTPGTGATLSPAADGKSATLAATAEGTYTVRLTLSASGAADSSDEAVFTIINDAVYESQVGCTGTCHSVRDPLIAAAYAISIHATEAAASCQDCHIQEVNQHPYDTSPWGGCEDCHTPGIVADFATSLHSSTPNPGLTCAACHTDHLFEPDPRVCYNCHSTMPSSTHATPQLADLCLQCHNPHSTAVTGEGMESHVGGAFNGTAAQYVGQTAVCSDCHANTDFSANAAILDEYATSGHGDVGSPAWITTSSHDWPTGSCKRCHSTTGFIDSVTGSTTAVEPGKPGQVLACNACHVSVVTGEVRDPGAYTATYDANGVTTTYDYPDVGPSNICLNCHSGRRSGAQVTEAATTTPHYLAAGGTLFNVIGYEFAGRVYEGIGYHRTVGMADNLGSGTDGPCVACHMSSGAGHTWDVVTTNAGGTITEVTSSACAACHSDMTAGKLNGKKADFRAALDTLASALAVNGIHYHDGSFFTAPYVEGGTNIAVDNAYYGTVAASIDAANGALPAPSKMDLQGAAFNLYLLDHSDPAAYVHNRGYAFRLIADSIDLFNDGVIDDDVAEAIQALNLPQAVKDAAINAIQNPEPWTHSTMAESDASPSTCSGCHDSAPHYGGVAYTAAGQDPAPRAQYVAQNLDCIDCHATDAFTRSSINVEFASSGHGDVEGEAWKHYDWAQSSRAACQRCHTTTGFVNDVTGSSTSLATGEPGQVLACSGCHENLAGGVVRTPGAYTATYSNGANAAFLDLGWSNICVRCHSGQESGNSIKNSTGDFSDLGFINSHYLAATATLYRTGYDFAGQAYGNPFVYSHGTLGIGNGGPCIGCHMYSIEGHGHTFVPVTKNEITGTITDITSIACGYCHSFTPADLTAKAAGMAAALDALEAQLAVSGIHFYPAYPYFYTAPYDETPGATNTAFRNWAGIYAGKGKDVMGAAFNLNLLNHEPGAYAHNQLYARRLVFDSIDFLDNGVLNGTIDLSAHSAAAAYLKPAAPASAVTRP